MSSYQFGKHPALVLDGSWMFGAGVKHAARVLFHKQAVSGATGSKSLGENHMEDSTQTATAIFMGL